MRRWQSSSTDNIGQVKANLTINRSCMIAVEDIATSLPTEAGAIIVRNDKSHSSLVKSRIVGICDKTEQEPSSRNVELALLFHVLARFSLGNFGNHGRLDTITFKNAKRAVRFVPKLVLLMNLG